MQEAALPTPFSEVLYRSRAICWSCAKLEFYIENFPVSYICDLQTQTCIKVVIFVNFVKFYKYKTKNS